MESVRRFSMMDSDVRHVVSPPPITSAGKAKECPNTKKKKTWHKLCCTAPNESTDSNVADDETHSGSVTPLSDSAFGSQGGERERERWREELERDSTSSGRGSPFHWTNEEVANLPSPPGVSHPLEPGYTVEWCSAFGSRTLFSLFWINQWVCSMNQWEIIDVLETVFAVIKPLFNPSGISSSKSGQLEIHLFWLGTLKSYFSKRA